jgi:hypothetical protein
MTTKVIGIDRKIKRAWLDATLDRLATTTDADKLREFVDGQLQDELPGAESRKKSVGIVLRIWSGIPADRVRFRDRAVALLPSITGRDRLWLHWGMAALAYPFFRDGVEVIGRLLTLQDELTTAQVQARLLPAWGDRTTTKQAAQKLLHTLVDWEVLRAAKAKGNFLVAKKTAAAPTPLQLWLLETLLAASAANEIEAQQLLRQPEAFPFAFTVGVADLRRHEGFDVHREGLDTEKVALRKVPMTEPAGKARKPRKAAGRATATAQPSLFDTQPAEAAEVPGGTWTPADAPFAAPAAECAELFRAGYHQGCVALALAVVESAVLLIWRVKLRKRRNQSADFMKALETLHFSSIIGGECKSVAKRLWVQRHLVLHYREGGEADSSVLEETARSS